MPEAVMKRNYWWALTQEVEKTVKEKRGKSDAGEEEAKEQASEKIDP